MNPEEFSLASFGLEDGRYEQPIEAQGTSDITTGGPVGLPDIFLRGELSEPTPEDGSNAEPEPQEAKQGEEPAEPQHEEPGVEPVVEEGVEESNLGGDVYSAFAQDLVKGNVLKFIDPKDISGELTPEQLSSLIDQEAENRAGDKVKRFEEAMAANVTVDEYAQYSNIIDTLSNIDEEQLSRENDAQAESTRRELIYMSYINKGFSEERAKREVEKSINAGTDVADAIDALEDCKNFYVSSYNNLLAQREAEAREQQAQIEMHAQALRSAVLEDNPFYEAIGIDPAIREQAYKALTEPAYKDKSTGQTLTALEYAMQSDPVSFSRNVGVLFALTDGFKDLSKIGQKAVQKEVSSKMSALEAKLRTPERRGNSQLVSSGGPIAHLIDGTPVKIR
jgi:hypothetical protein|nr:MAG TPA: hypothetical protein [Crassvirales sp.]